MIPWKKTHLLMQESDKLRGSIFSLLKETSIVSEIHQLSYNYYQTITLFDRLAILKNGLYMESSGLTRANFLICFKFKGFEGETVGML